MQQGAFARSRWRDDRNHLSLSQNQVRIRQHADAFLTAAISFLQPAGFQNSCGAARILVRHFHPKLCVLGHSAAAPFSSASTASAVYLDASSAIPVPLSDTLPLTQSVSHFDQSIACLKEGNFASN